MGYFDGLSGGFFKKDAAGRELFFPRGRWGKGRVVPNEEDGAALRRYLKHYQIGLIAGIVLLVWVGGDPFEDRWFIAIGAYAALAAVCWAPMQRRVRAWQQSDERLSYRESLVAEAKAHSLASLWGSIATWLLLVALFVACFIYADSTLQRVIFALAATLFAVVGSIYLFMLRTRKRT